MNNSRTTRNAKKSEISFEWLLPHSKYISDANHFLLSDKQRLDLVLMCSSRYDIATID